MLVAKYQALAFFSDAMSFQIIRNLGGGSLVDALLYALSDAGLMLIALAGAAAFYLVALFVLRRWERPFPARTSIVSAGARARLAFAALAAAAVRA